MKLTGEVMKLETVGDGIEVTISNLTVDAAAFWRGKSKEIAIVIPLCRQGSYRIGRKVSIEVTPD